VLEKTIKGKSLYSGKRLAIPCPEFYVLYNGTDQFPDNAVLRLSDLFEKPQDLGLPEKANPLLELEVKVININEGRNDAIVTRCKKLAEYSAFVAKARTFLQDTENREEAIKEAVKYCQKHDILKEFLEIYGSEVLNMLITEWNMEDCIAVRCEEARDDERLEIARKMKSKGRPIEVIVEDTGLSVEVVEKLPKEDPIVLIK